MKRKSLFFCLLFLIISSIIYSINFLYLHYPGNNYFPDGATYALLTLGFTYWGVVLLFEKKHTLAQYIKEIGFLFFVMSVIAYATNAIQYTPFPIIDKYLIHCDSFFHVSIDQWIHPNIILTWAYESLSIQLCAIPLWVIYKKQYQVLYQFYELLLICTMLGFMFYYFFPSTGPASHFHSVYFTKAQYATGLKFNQIHHYISPTTLEGGLIACPSFHVIWAACCTYLLKPWKILFAITGGLNILLSIACVILGWHYFTDILMSFFLLLILYFLHKLLSNKRTSKLKNLACLPIST